MADMFANWILL